MTEESQTENRSETNYETVESLEIEEGDYFPLERVNIGHYGYESDDNEWDVVFRTASLRENESTHLIQDPEGKYVLFSSNIDNYHSIKQIGDDVVAEPITPDGHDNLHPYIADCFDENVLGDRSNFYTAEFRGDELHVDLHIKDGWNDDELEILGEATHRDVAFRVDLVDEEE